MYKEYCYDFDYNFYRYKNEKLTKITRKEYKEKTGETDFIINKLRESRWPVQQNDYFFLKSGKHFWPIDWKLFDLIKFFRANGIYSSSSHQGKNSSFISFGNIKDIDKIKELFGAENVILFPMRKIIIDEDGSNNIYDEKVEKKKLKESDKYHDKIRIYPEEVIYYDGSDNYKSFTIDFNTNIIEKMYNKLGLKIPKHSEAHKGSRIVHPGKLKKLLK
jgi:hypothetical protein